MPDVAELVVRVKAPVEEAQANLKQVSQDLQQLGQNAQSAGDAVESGGTARIREFGTAMNTVGDAASGLGQKLSLGLTAPLAAIGAAGIKIAADFQESLNVFQSVSGATASQMAQVSAKATALGADLSLPATSANDAAQAMLELNKAGLNVNETLAAAKGVLQLSAAANMSNAEAAQVTANALNAFGLQGKDATRVADLLAGASNAASGEVSDMAFAMRSGASVAALANQKIEDFTTAIALMANKGIIGSDAGTSLKTMFMRLIAPTKEVTDELKALGISVNDTSGHMKPLRELVLDFNRALGPNATVTRAVGGSIEDMSKALQKAETAAKGAYKDLALLPGTLQQQHLQLGELRRKLDEVDGPAQKLRSTIAGQKAEVDRLTKSMKDHITEGQQKLAREQTHLTEVIQDQEKHLANLTSEMKKNIDEGLRKMGRETENAKGRIRETTIELQQQQLELRRLKSELASMDAPTTDKGREEYLAKQLEIEQLSNRIRENKANVEDWTREIQENDRQMRFGLDATKEKQREIDRLSLSLNENKQKLSDLTKVDVAHDAATQEKTREIDRLNGSIKENEEKLRLAAGAQKELATVTLQNQIRALTVQMQEEQAKLIKAPQLLKDLDKARENAVVVTRKMTDADRAQILSTVFGSDAIRAASIVLRTSVHDWDNMKAAVTRHGQAADTARAHMMGLNGALQGLKSQMETLGQQMFGPQLQGLTALVGRVSDFVARLGTLPPAVLRAGVAFGALAAAAGPVLLVVGQIASAIGSLITAGPAVAAALGTVAGVLTGPVGLAIAATVAAVGALYLAWKNNWGGMRDTLQAVWSTVQPYLQQVWSVLQTSFTQVFGAMKAFWQQIWPPIKQISIDTWRDIQTFLTGAWNVLKVVMQGTWGNIAAAIKGAWDSIIGMVKAAWAVVAGIIVVGLKVLSGDWKGAWEAMVQYATQAFEGFKQAVGGTLSFLGNLAEAAGKMALNIGTAIVQGIVNGIQAGAATIWNAVVSIAQNAIAAAKNALGIASPSKVFQDIGADVMQGFSDGMMNNDTMDTITNWFAIAVAQATTAEVNAQSMLSIGHGFSPGMAVGSAMGSMETQSMNNMHQMRDWVLMQLRNGQTSFNVNGHEWNFGQYAQQAASDLGFGGSGGSGGQPAPSYLPPKNQTSLPAYRIAADPPPVNLTVNGDINSEADENRLASKLTQSLRRTLRFA